ncbi:MAG: hypothetical protein ABIG44_02410 [Planctomycetota bacterium]
MSKLIGIVCGLCLLGTTPDLAAQECVGLGDLDADGRVRFSDFELLATQMTGPDVPAGADLDGDADADLRDVAAFGPLYYANYFSYGPARDNLEAEMLAMKLTGQMRAPDKEYERILLDLALIRAEYPELITVVDDMDYAPNQLLVGIGSSTPPEYDELNAFYLLVDEEVHTTWRVLTFCGNLNAEVLAGIYAGVPGVNWTDPNWLIGTDDIITIEVIGDTYRYNIDDGFWDCFDGCDCHREWVLDVDLAGNVILISYEEWGWSWCVFD